jgi:mRNA-degrading endonuclease toxin of MazEF toxin-antitoxin module
VILVRFPHPSGARGKKRPAVIVQSDAHQQIVQTVVVAEVTKNLAMAAHPTCLYIDTATPEGQATGLLQNSVVAALLLATVKADRIDQVIGTLSDSMKQKLGDCLKAALELP